MDLGPHATFIWLCYAVVAIVVLALVGWLLVQGRHRENELMQLERRGAVRGKRAGAADR